MFRTLERYDEDGLGLPYPVTLLGSAVEMVDDETGAVKGVHVPDIEQLAAAVAMTRVLLPVSLRGPEVRFIRRTLSLSSGAFAAELNMDASTFSRWENDKQTVGEWADKEVRRIAIILLQKQFPNFSADTTAVVGMKILKVGKDAPWPEIQMRRVGVACTEETPKHWDTLPLAA